MARNNFDPRKALEEAFEAGLVYRGGRFQLPAEESPELGEFRSALPPIAQSARFTTLYAHPDYDDVGTTESPHHPQDNASLSAALTRLMDYGSAEGIEYAEYEEKYTETRASEYSSREWEYPKTQPARKLLRQAQKIVADYPSLNMADAYAMACVYLTGDVEQLNFPEQSADHRDLNYQQFKTLILNGDATIEVPDDRGYMSNIRQSFEDMRTLKPGHCHHELAVYTAKKLGVSYEQAVAFQHLLSEDFPDYFRRQFAHRELYRGLKGETFNVLKPLLPEERFATAEEAYNTLKETHITFLWEKENEESRTEKDIEYESEYKPSLSDLLHDGYREVPAYIAAHLIDTDTPNAREEIEALTHIYATRLDAIKRENYWRGSLITGGEQYDTPPEDIEFDEARLRHRQLESIRAALRDNAYPKHSLSNARWLRDKVGVTSKNEAIRFLTLYDEIGKNKQRNGNSVDLSSSDAQEILAISSKMAHAPLWVQAEVYRAGINSERCGSPVDLFDAAKAWRVSPLIPKKEAIRIGRMEPWKRMVAAGIIEQKARDLGVSYSYAENGQITFKYPETERFAGKSGRAGWESQKDIRAGFWQEFQKAVNLGQMQALTKYAKDTKINRKRIIQLMREEPEMSEQEFLQRYGHLKIGSQEKRYEEYQARRGYLANLTEAQITILAENVPTDRLYNFNFEAWESVYQGFRDAVKATGYSYGYEQIDINEAAYAAKAVANFGPNHDQIKHWLKQPLVQDNLPEALAFLPRKKHKMFQSLEHGLDFLRVFEAIADQPERFSNIEYEEDSNGRLCRQENGDVNPYDLIPFTPQVNQVDPEILCLAMRASYPVRNPQSSEDQQWQEMAARGWKVHPLVWPELADEIAGMSLSEQLIAIGIIEQMAKEHGHEKNKYGYFQSNGGESINLSKADSPETLRVRFRQGWDDYRKLNSAELSEWHSDASIRETFKQRLEQARQLTYSEQFSAHAPTSEYYKEKIIRSLHPELEDKEVEYFIENFKKVDVHVAELLADNSFSATQKRERLSRLSFVLDAAHEMECHVPFGATITHGKGSGTRQSILREYYENGDSLNWKQVLQGSITRYLNEKKGRLTAEIAKLETEAETADSATRSNILMPEIRQKNEEIETIDTKLSSFNNPEKMRDMSSIKDMVDDIALHVVKPAMVVEFGGQEDEAGKEVVVGKSYQTSKYEAAARQIALKLLLKENNFLDLSQQSQIWHRTDKKMPMSIKDKDIGGWKHLFTNTEGESYYDIEHGGKTYRFRSLNTKEALGKEGDMLNHCVGRGGYGDKCMRAEAHIVSVRLVTEEGKEKLPPLSTMEVQGSSGRFKVQQNRGYDNSTPKQETLEASARFMAILNNPEIKVDLKEPKAIQSREVKAANERAYDELLENYYVNKVGLTGSEYRSFLASMRQGEGGALAMAGPGATITTETSASGKTSFRYIETHDTLLILGLITADGKLVRDDLEFAKASRELVRDAAQNGKTIISSVNSKSAPLLDSILKGVESMDNPEYKYTRQKEQTTNHGPKLGEWKNITIKAIPTHPDKKKEKQYSTKTLLNIPEKFGVVSIDGQTITAVEQVFGFSPTVEKITKVMHYYSGNIRMEQGWKGDTCTFQTPFGQTQIRRESKLGNIPKGEKKHFMQELGGNGVYEARKMLDTLIDEFAKEHKIEVKASLEPRQKAAEQVVEAKPDSRGIKPLHELGLVREREEVLAQERA